MTLEDYFPSFKTWITNLSFLRRQESKRYYFEFHRYLSMNNSTLTFSLLIILSISCTQQLQSIFVQKTIYKREIKEKLNYPFGTVLNLEAEIINGNDYPLASWRSQLLIKINAVNNSKLDTTKIFFFDNEDITFNNYDSLINKPFNLVGFETGGFIGKPTGSEGYILASSYLYHFQNRIVILDVEQHN